MTSYHIKKKMYSKITQSFKSNIFDEKDEHYIWSGRHTFLTYYDIFIFSDIAKGLKFVLKLEL